MTLHNAWIDPDGTIHHVPVGTHDVVARQLGYGSRNTALACGLIRIGWLNSAKYDVDYWRTITESQYNVLYDLLSVVPETARQSIAHALATAQVL